MQQPEPTGYRIWISAGLGILGVSLIGVSFFVSDDAAHVALTHLIQLIMIISGCGCIVGSVILFFVKDNPDIWS